MIRQPIITFLGHIDSGKTSIQDFIRSTSVTKGEAGAITQQIECSGVPLETIKKICGPLLKSLKMKFTIPGILMIDSPGHAAFQNLRKRGGNLADIAILVIDAKEGVKEQTLECIEILKNYKTPFIVALNKIDLLPGWRAAPDKKVLDDLEEQSDSVKELLDKKLYEVVGKISELGFDSERFDKVDDYTKQIAIIPVSAKTGEGIAELLMVLTGLAQKYLEKSLKIEVKGAAKGTILEVKEEPGLGITLDTIIYDGSLNKNDLIVIGSLDKPIVTKVRALFEPSFEKREKYSTVESVHAATGVKISAPDLEDAVAGMPLRVATEKNLEQVKKEIQKEVQEVLLEVEKEGVIVKADSLGSLEALIGLLKEEKISIKKASIGDVTKKDVAEASAEKDPLKIVVLGFNIKALESKEVKIICHDVIYKIIEDFKKWKKEEAKKLEAKELEDLIKPCKVQILKGCIFRQSKPAVVGVSVLNGTLFLDTPLMKENGDKVSSVKSMQLEKENIQKAEKNKEVAISLPEVTVGRQIYENDTLLADIPEKDFKKLKELKKYLSKDEIEVLKEIAAIKRKKVAMWGI